ISKEIEAINLKLDKVEQIKIFGLVTDNWTVETGELSPTMKLKRKFLQRKYAVMIEQLYV
ncbi:MAG: hypothetical protein Q8T08_13715, partial [Ignavibacteria bacterium]|nr:hypothetical protein [Ignavibacteria bacterium]